MFEMTISQILGATLIASSFYLIGYITCYLDIKKNNVNKTTCKKCSIWSKTTRTKLRQASGPILLNVGNIRFLTTTFKEQLCFLESQNKSKN